MPNAPPTCWVVLTRPDANPESSGATPDIARVISDGNGQAGADAHQHEGREDVGEVGAVDARAAQPGQSGGDEQQRREQHGARPEAGDQPRGEPEGHHADRDRDRQERRARRPAPRTRARAAGTAPTGRTCRASPRRRASGRGSRRRRRGSAGCRAAAAASRPSPAATTKATSSANATARQPPGVRVDDRVDGEHQGRGDQDGARGVGARGPAEAGLALQQAHGQHEDQRSPIGTLTKKIQCQLSVSVRTPPSSRPIDAPAEPTKPKTPIAFACSRGSREHRDDHAEDHGRRRARRRRPG